MKTKMTIGAIALIGTAGLASAGASEVLSFTYSDLMGSFDAGTGMYQAVVGAGTSGDVTLVPTNETAEFDSGSFSGTSAGFSLDLTISNITANSADGVGSLIITDADGDTVTADVSGTFNLLFGSVFYEGFLGNAFVNPLGDGQFDGTTAGSWDTDLPGQPFVGSLVELFFDPGDFFASSFDDQTTLASGLLVPTPGAAALLGAAGLVATRRRR